MIVCLHWGWGGWREQIIFSLQCSVIKVRNLKSYLRDVTPGASAILGLSLVDDILNIKPKFQAYVWGCHGMTLRILGRAEYIFHVRGIWIIRGQTDTYGSCYIGGPLMHQPSWYTCPHLVLFNIDSGVGHLTIFDQWNINKLNTSRGLIKACILGFVL